MQGIKQDYRTAPISDQEKGLLDYAVKLTKTPAAMTRGDLEALKNLGWSEKQISDAVQVIAYFNYINRIADALGVEKDSNLEREFPDV